MSNEVNINEVTASIVTTLIGDAKNWLSGICKDFWIKNLASFKKYYNDAYNRYSTTKTLLYKDKAVKVSDIYVGTFLRQGGSKLKDIELISKIEQGTNILITATAGAGKSFFTKYLFLALISGKCTGSAGIGQSWSDIIRADWAGFRVVNCCLESRAVLSKSVSQREPSDFAAGSLDTCSSVH